MAALLPSATRDFASVEYWDRFFDARSGAPFAWYLDPAHAAALVAAVLRAASNAPDDAPTVKRRAVLNLGCGTCTLPLELARRVDVARWCDRVASIDASAVAVRELAALADCAASDVAAPALSFEVADALALQEARRGADDDGYAVVVDKGLLDALHDDAGGECAARCDALFASIASALPPRATRTDASAGGAALLIISLLQSHVQALVEATLGGAAATRVWARLVVRALRPPRAASPLRPFALCVWAHEGCDEGEGEGGGVNLFWLDEEATDGDDDARWRVGGTPLGRDWRALWARVGEAQAAFRADGVAQCAAAAAPPARRVAVTVVRLSVRLAPDAALAHSVAAVNAAVEAAVAPCRGFVGWHTPHETFELGFGVHAVRVSALLRTDGGDDDDALDAEALCVLLRDALGVPDEDDEEEDDDGSETSPLATGVDIIDVQFADAALPGHDVPRRAAAAAARGGTAARRRPRKKASFSRFENRDCLHFPSAQKDGRMSTHRD